MKLPLKKFPDGKIILFQLFILAAILVMISLFLQGCTDKCESVTTYTVYEPVYTTTQEVRDAFEVMPPRLLESPGKIYVYGNYLLINEVEKGVHVIDNSNCESPQPIAFINIPGNFDIAVKDYILYADSYVDLLAIDIHDLNNIQLLKRLESAFPLYNRSWEFVAASHFATEPDNIIVEWVEVEKTMVDAECNHALPPIMLMERGIAMDLSASSAVGNSSPQGKAGSMARFAIHQDFLYAVDSYQMHVFDISQVEDPQEGNVIDMGWGIETIFPHKDKLFIGAQNGMHIYENADPTEPVYLSSFLHVTTCDPVVVDDNFAYVTLRSGTECQGFTNQLDVINISDLTNPYLVKSYPMQNPHGLGKDQDILFITEGDFGLKIFNAADPQAINQHLLAHFDDMHGFDVIPNDGTLLMIGNDGLYQYRYEDIQNLSLCSVIPIQNQDL